MRMSCCRLWIIALLAAACRLAPAVAAAPDTRPADPLETVLPTVEFSHNSLEQVVTYLEEKAPGFKAVVVRDRDVPPDYPSLQLKLDNVTLVQLLQVLQKAYPGLSLEPIGENDGPTPIYVCRVQNAASKAGTTDAPQVRVYRLTALLHLAPAGNGSEEDATHKALDNVLSLIKATLSEVPGGTDPDLQVHPETQTLIFKGTDAQRAALEQVLAALDPSASLMDAQIAESRKQASEVQEQRIREQAQAGTRIEELQSELELERARATELQRMLLDQSMQNEKLQIRLENQENMEKFKEDWSHQQSGGPAAGPAPTHP